MTLVKHAQVKGLQFGWPFDAPVGFGDSLISLIAPNPLPPPPDAQTQQIKVPYEAKTSVCAGGIYFLVKLHH